ncbi:hypothetical protein T03_13182, partial [Trichinella britovi]
LQMEMKIDGNLSVHQRISRFHSDNAKNHTDERSKNFLKLKVKFFDCYQECDGAIWTNLDVTTVIKRNDHIESCPVDEHLAYKMEKRAVLTKRSAEETKSIPAIYDEEASAASAEPSTSGYFPPFKWSASRHILIFGTGTNIRLLAACRTWGMDGTFKFVPQWYQQLFTIHAFAAGKLVLAVYCLCTDKDIGTYGFKSQALISRAAALEVGFNPDTNICDFETALISTSARRYIGKPLLIAEQGVMDTLIQQVLSGNVTVGDLRP